ncbi:MAG: hypothetical protein K0R78_176 [Pelosinus sp.]|jgi:hypothetical protein|nr:hypothetical protein [Pelosinus sp.]
MSLFQSLNSDELALAATILAVAFSKGLNATDLNTLGNFIIAVGSIMTSIASQEQGSDSQNFTTKEQVSKNLALGKEPDIQQQIVELQKQVEWLINNRNL